MVKEDNILEITEMLFDTLNKNEGIGLAGPQINHLKRIFVIDTSPLLEDDINVERFKDVFINPLIINRSTENEIYKEGCLSFPGIYEDVIRPEKILVRYHDISFNIIEKELDGIKARIFQHEFDHLEGILFIDKINPLKLKLLYGKLNKIKKVARKSIADYKKRQ